MGNCGSKGDDVPLKVALAEDYQKLGLPALPVFQNEIEKEIFITVNMVRNQPKRMAKLVPKIKDDKLLSKEALKSLSAL